MNHFPIFVALAGRRVILSGGGDAALAKLRLLLRTKARITVFARDPAPQIEAWAAKGQLDLIRRAMAPGDARAATLFYAADEDAGEDARTAAIARAEGSGMQAMGPVMAELKPQLQGRADVGAVSKLVKARLTA